MERRATDSNAEPPEVMIVSRGHGYGHALPDMAIAAKLTDLVQNLRLQFVSYAAGAHAYRACGYEVLDLNLPDTPPFLDMVIAFTRLLAQGAPKLVIAHEEIPVLPAAKLLDIPCLFIVHFFTDPSSLFMQALQYAAEVVFTAEPGLFTEPPYLRSKICYVGRAVRPFHFTLADRDRARRELRIPLDETVVLCQPGAWIESRVPLVDLLGAAWNLVPRCPKRLIWIAGRDRELLAARFLRQTDVMILKEDWQIDRLMAASDLLITKGNRQTTYEAASLGLPSISISNLTNWTDDVAIANVESNTAVRSDSVTAQGLSELIAEKAGIKSVPAADISTGVAGAAKRIAYYVGMLRHSSSTTAPTTVSRVGSAPEINS